MATTISIPGHTTLFYFTFGIPVLPPSPQTSNKINLFATAKSTRAVRCAVSYKERSERGRKRREQFQKQYGIDPSDWDPRTSKSSKLSKREQEEKERTSTSAATSVPRTTHRILKIIRGKAHGRKLLSPTGMDVRPMMEVVRGASFDILQVAGGCPASLRPGRWLDLYSGTGSVGIEAISRGCAEVHFVEMDPWVVEKVLKPNIKHTGFEEQSTIHMVRVEAFLEQSLKTNCKFGSFDYISVTPPYQTVDYSVLMGQLSNSSLVGKDAFILVEHPQNIVMHDTCGSLVKIVDKRYGRTLLAVYGPEWSKKSRPSKSS